MNVSIKKQVLDASRQGNLPLFLTRLIYELTLAARSAYSEEAKNSQESYQKLRTINELIHTCAGKLGPQIAGDPPSKQYPTDVFLDILIEKAGVACAGELELAVQRALRSNGSGESYH